MNFGSNYAWVTKNEQDAEEEVFEDDINDGLESAANRDEIEEPVFFNNIGEVNAPPVLIPQQQQQQQQQNAFPQQQQQQQNAFPQQQRQNVFQNNNSNSKPFMPRKTNQKKKVKAASTNVIGLDLGKLGESAAVATGEPIFCNKCKVMFNSHSVLDKKSEGSNNNMDISDKLWKCEFCGEENKIQLEEEEIPKEETIDYLLEPAIELGENQGETNTVIFVIDTSGSMCVTTEVQGKIKLKGEFSSQGLNIDTEGAQQWMPNQNRNVTYISRLQCVQASVEKQIENFAKENPNKKVAIVCFNSEVSVIGDGTTPVVTIGGDKLSNFDLLLAEGKKLSITNNIKQTKKDLINKLYKLQESGTTALGPGLVVALGMASETKGNTIVLLTDGLSNVGVGAMEDLYTQEQQETAEKFYRKVGELAQENGTTISITSIEGSECKMENLGLVAELSNGEVDIVDPLQLTNNFTNILSKAIVATECNLIFKVHQGMIIQDDQTELGGDTLAKNVGNVSNDLTITFEYSIKSLNDLKKLDIEQLKFLPFQVQIYYKDLQGAKKVRCISKQQPITTDKKEAEKNINVNVVSANTVQQCAKLATRGLYSESRTKMVANQKMMRRNLNNDYSQSNGYANFVNAASELDNALKEQETEEVQFNQVQDERSRKTNRKDKVSKAIYQAKKWK